MRGTTRTRNVMRRTHRARRVWLSERILSDGVAEIVEEVEDDLALVAMKPDEPAEPLDSGAESPPPPSRDPES